MRTYIYMELAIISLQYLDLLDIFLCLIELPPWHGWPFFLLPPFTVYAAVWLMLPNDSAFVILIQGLYNGRLLMVVL